jgi:hypothetical protein
VFINLYLGNIIAVSLHNIAILKNCDFFFSYFCNTHIVCSPWGPQAPNKTSSLFMETNGNYSSHKQTSLNSRDDDGDGAISGDFSYSVSAKKEGEPNYCQE